MKSIKVCEIIAPISFLRLDQVKPKEWRERYLSGEYTNIKIPLIPDSNRMFSERSIMSDKTHSPIDDVHVSRTRTNAGSAIVTIGCKPFNECRYRRSGNIEQRAKILCFYCAKNHFVEDSIPMPVSFKVIIDAEVNEGCGKKLRRKDGEKVYEISGPGNYCRLECQLKVALKKNKRRVESTKYSWSDIISNIYRLHQIMCGDSYVLLHKANSRKMLTSFGGPKSREEWETSSIEYQKLSGLVYWPAKETYKTVK